jgi:hypothetical protein
MSALMEACRALASNGVRWVGFQVLQVEGRERWPDKSTAVGRGACGWEDEVICASHSVAPLAPRARIAAFPCCNAPSLPFCLSERASA